MAKRSLYKRSCISYFVVRGCVFFLFLTKRNKLWVLESDFLWSRSTMEFNGILFFFSRSLKKEPPIRRARPPWRFALTFIQREIHHRRWIDFSSSLYSHAVSFDWKNAHSFAFRMWNVPTAFRWQCANFRNSSLEKQTNIFIQIIIIIIVVILNYDYIICCYR